MSRSGAPRHDLVIAGSRVAPDDGHYPLVNPATEEVLAYAPEASATQVRQSVGAAREALGAWSSTSPGERSRILKRTADLLVERTDELVELGCAETGATEPVFRGMHVAATAARFRRYARAATQPLDGVLDPISMPDTILGPGGYVSAVTVRQPVGVVGAITSYNNPLANTAGKLAPALAMGNTVVVKPAPQDPLCVLMLADLLAEAGLPAGVCSVVTGSGPEVGAALVDADVDMVSFTGSSEVGARIAGNAGPQMKRQLMELGGKGAAIVTDDADLASAVRGIETVWTFYSGQICTAPTRVVADRAVAGELVERLAKRAAELGVGDPRDSANDVGPVISAAHRERVERFVRLGREEGASLVAGGARPQLERGFYVAPTLFVDVTNDMAIAREEVFGPVVVVIAVDGDEEAIGVANDSDYGLIDYVWSADVRRAQRIGRRLRAGGVQINSAVRHMEAPFGGFKRSGIGRDCGDFAMTAYSELQSLTWVS